MEEVASGGAAFVQSAMCAILADTFIKFECCTPPADRPTAEDATTRMTGDNHDSRHWLR
jgi:hypothetical protein